jgi:TonB family protein
MRRVYGGVIVALTLLSGAGGAGSAQEDGPVYDADMKLVSFEDLSYPAVSQAARLQGVVVVSADLDDRGNVAKAKALSGEHTLIPAAIENAKRWTFVPNTKKTVVIVYDFRIDGTCHRDRPSLFRLRYPNFASITACGSQLQVESRPKPE